MEVPNAARQVHVRGKVDKVIEPVVELCKILSKQIIYVLEILILSLLSIEFILDCVS